MIWAIIFAGVDLLFTTAKGSSLTCGNLKTVYNSANCCADSGMTCTNVLPSCAAGQILISDGNGGWNCGDLPSASIPMADGSTPTATYFMVDREDAPQNCVVQTAEDIENNKQAFIDQYNAEGIPPQVQFQSGNCCIAVSNG